MAYKITMPASGQTAAESLIVRWHAKEGDQIDRGDVLFEIETDKATMNVESFAKGTLLKVAYGEGEKVEAGKVVAYIGKPGEQIGAGADAAAQGGSDAGEEDEYQPIMGAKETASRQPEAEPAAKEKNKAVLMASPAARKLAGEKGSDLGNLYENLGRPVRAADVASAVLTDVAEYDSTAPTAMRRVIARRMLESAAEAPQFTVTVKVDMTSMIALRRQINEALAEEGLKVSFNDLLVKCVCAAVKKAPYLNGRYVSDDEIRIMRRTSVGIAVALPEGLVVPVIKNADTMSLREIAQKGRDLIAAAKEGSLQAEQMQGGTITISNLGMYGIDHFTALVNRPESAILAVGGIVETPVVQDGQVVVRPVMDITASFDHRLIDGGVGALFMAELKKLVERPASALL